jgi:outer membrane murein-binding lipoprotein Lpp
MGHQLQAEWANVSGAPLLFCGAVIAAALALWGFVHFIYKAKIDRLEQDVRSEQAEVARLRAKFGESSLAPNHPVAPQGRKQAPPSERGALAKPLRQKALIEVDKAAYAARIALENNNRKEMLETLPSIKSALLTLAKAYEIRVPGLESPSAPDRALIAAGDYLTEIVPFLRGDHVLEARSRASSLSPSLEKYVLGFSPRPNY